jgi:hypothetical protein
MYSVGRESSIAAKATAALVKLQLPASIALLFWSEKMDEFDVLFTRSYCGVPASHLLGPSVDTERSADSPHNMDAAAGDQFSDDEEFDRTVAQIFEDEAAAASAAATRAAASAAVTGGAAGTATIGKLGKVNRFQEFKDPVIEQELIAQWALQNKKLSYSSIGYWTMFYDQENVAEAWTRFTSLYSARQLPGVVKLSRATGLDEQIGTVGSSGRVNRGLPILIFTGPIDQESHVKAVGTSILLAMNYTQQKCSKKYRPEHGRLDFPKKIYFKVTMRKAPLYELTYK